MSPGDVITRFDGVRRTRSGWSARCPAHNDRQNSLSIAIGDDDRTLVNCFRGCRFDAIARAIGLEPRDLFPVRTANEPRPGRRLVVRTPLDDARQDVLRAARCQARRMAPYLEIYAEADSIRGCRQIISRARQFATTLGDVPVSWELLGAAADLELMVLAAETRLDEELAV